MRQTEYLSQASVTLQRKLQFSRVHVKETIHFKRFYSAVSCCCCCCNEGEMVFKRSLRFRGDLHSAMYVNRLSNPCANVWSEKNDDDIFMLWIGKKKKENIN